MCGIFGWQFIRRITEWQYGVLTTVLAMEMQRRGEHSHGAFVIDANGVTVVKRTGALLSNGALLQSLSQFNTVAVHTRHATHGAVNEANAHPFEYGDIVGMHNGIIANHAELNLKYGRKFDVDSMHIFANIAESKKLKSLEGYGAVAYVDKRAPSRVNLARFNNGELSIARVKDHGVTVGVLFASTRKAIEDACTVATLEYEFVKVQQAHVLYCEDGEVWQGGEKFHVREDVRSLRWDSWKPTTKPTTTKATKPTTKVSVSSSSPSSSGASSDGRSRCGESSSFYLECQWCGCEADQHIDVPRSGAWCTRCGTDCGDYEDSYEADGADGGDGMTIGEYFGMRGGDDAN